MTEFRPWYRFIRWLVRNTFFRYTGGLKAVNEENFPKDGAVIVAPNHISHVDPPAVGCACPRVLRFMAKEELFKGIFGWMIASLGAYPVKRGEGDTEAIRKTIALLEAGEAVLVFPEGTRGDGQHLQPMEKGATMLAKRTGAWVLPVAIVGSHIVLPRGKSKPGKSLIKIAYGEPFKYEDVLPGGTEKERREAFAVELRSRLLKLCEQHGLPLKIGSKLESPEESRSIGTAT